MARWAVIRSAAAVALTLNVCACAASGSPTNAPVATATPAATGRFYTQGAKIIDPKGKVFVARGANINGPAYHFRSDPIDNPGPLGMSSLDMIANCWKFNIVRVNTFASSMLLYPEDFDRIVKAFTERGIVVMIEPHDYTGRYPSPDVEMKMLAGGHRTLAARYKDNPYVWFNVMNEPNAEKPEQARDLWVETHRTLIRAIRETGADNIIVADAHGWGQDNRGGSGSSILNWGGELQNFDNKAQPNIVFSLHVYELWNNADQAFAEYFDTAAAKGLPLIVGEFGMLNGPRDTLPASTSMMAAAKPRGIGWLVWHFDGGDTNDLTLPSTGGWMIDDCAAPANLTPLGRLVWDGAPSGTK
jgi:sugar phosphate isomerase/epimerase